MIDIQTPPPEWIGASAPIIVEHRLWSTQINTVCRTLGADVPPGKDVYGCAIEGPGGCSIFIPKIDFGFDLADQDKVREHERAHCKGWRHETK